jgi:hypothetical protein
VGDVDDGDVVGGEVADDREQPLDLLAVQDGRRLVHDDQLRVLGERAGDADHLLRGRRQGADLGGGPDVGVAQTLQQAGCGAIGRGRAGEPEPGVLPAEEDVVGDGEAGDQVELLVDRRNSERHRRLRVAEPDRLPAPADPAGVGLVRPREHLDEGRLAGAVLAEQAVHLPRADVEVDAVERPDTGEGLDDPVHLQQRGGAGRPDAGRGRDDHCGTTAASAQR